jgi:hypothetical protein
MTFTGKVTTTLGEFADQADDVEGGAVALRIKAPVPPQLVDNLRKLRKLELLTDEVVWSLIAQAPIDPLGVYGAMKDMGVWAFSGVDFTMVQVLAKAKDVPVALMRIDLMSDDITFVALEKGQLVQVSVIEAAFMEETLRRPGATETSVLALIQQHMKGAIDKGLLNAGVSAMR